MDRERLDGMSGNLFPQVFTKEMKVEALDRELTFRRRVYADRVANGKMSQRLSDYQIAVFEAILADYEEGDDE